MALVTLTISSATNDLMAKDIDALLNKYADEYKIEKALVHAIAKKESGKNCLAIRVEPQLKTQSWYLKTLPDKYKEDNYAYCSMGVLQVLYGIARHHGFEGTPFDLMSPDNSIKYGCLYIKDLIKRYFYIDKVISSYNQGGPWMTGDGKSFKNQDYVDLTMKYYREFGGKN